MDTDEEIVDNETEQTEAAQQMRDTEEPVDEAQPSFCSEMHPSQTIESEKNTKYSDALNEDKLEIGPFNHTTSELQEFSQASEKPTDYEDNFLQHRGNEEFFASDEQSVDSNSSGSSDDSSCGASARKSEYCYTFSEQLNAIPCFYDYREKCTNLLALNKLMKYHDDEVRVQGSYEDITTQLNQVILNVECSKSSNSSESDSEKPSISSERISISDCHSSEGNKQFSSAIPTPRLTRLQPSDHCSQILQLPTKTEVTSQCPSVSSHFVNLQSSECRISDIGVYSMITTPISSNYINLESSTPLQSSETSNTYHKYEMEMPLLNSTLISSERFSKRSLSPTAEAVNSPNFKTSRMKFSRSLELPSSSNCSTALTKEWQQSNASTFSCFGIRNKNASSLTNLSNSANKPKKLESRSFFQCHIRRTQKSSSRLLNMNDSDTSSDDTKGNTPKKKENRKRRKTFPKHISRARENQSILSKKDNDENFSEKAHCFPSTSQNYHKKSLNLKGNDSENYVLRSLDMLNSENLETPCRKRLASNGKISDAEQSNGERETNKKLKRIPSDE